MKYFKFLPEFLCLLLFTVSSAYLGHSIQKTELLNKEFNTLLLLESALPKHQVQLLNANFSEQLHYDDFSQLQSQIETVLYELKSESELKDLLHSYTHTSSSYIQLISMLKTSQRLLSMAEVSLGKEHPELIIKIRTLLFSFVTKPDVKTKYHLHSLLKFEEPTLDNEQEKKYWQLFKLHGIFLLDNIETTALYRQALIDMPIIQESIKSIKHKKNSIQEVQSSISLSIFCAVLAILLILIVILKRQQQELSKSTLAYKHAAEVKTQFLANMSHEIRTPMTGIIGLVELCLKTQLNEEQQSYLEKVEFSATSLLTIINDILDFSKIESGQLPIETVPVEHNKLIDNLNMMLGRTAEEKGIELIIDVDPQVPAFILGDPVRLNQILLNLLSNAVKFTETGHVIFRIKVQFDQKYENPHRLLYQVEDTGIGLSSEQISKLFRRFSQADESTTRKYGGTGLGLAISKLLVDLMEGKVWVESELGKGSTFNVIFPLVVDKCTADTLLPVKFENKRLLLLEDNEVTQHVIKKMAEYFNVTLDVSSTIKQAEKLCARNNYDIALVDWNLKEESGIDFIDHIYEKEICPKELVVCSAYSRAYIEKHTTVNCHLKYLAKPLTLNSFKKLLTDCSQPDSHVAGENKIKLESPAIKADSNIDETETRAEKGEGKGHTILLVEDNKINQIVATKLLQSLGLNVDVAEDGEEAIFKIMQGNYSVVLMDIQMPKMDGTEATIKLRQTYGNDTLKIIALTANITEEEVKYYSSIGMNGHLGKPYEIEKMKETLAKYITL